MKKRIIGIATAVIVCEFAGILGSFFTSAAQSLPGWYAGLNKPPLTPPNWVFAPVWTLLFALMGVAAYLVWERRGHALASAGLGLFAVQLALNVAWSALFFGLRAPLLAAIEIVALWTAIAVTTWLFARVSRTAAYLMVPYLLWVAFAAYLNFSIVALNR